MDRSSVHTYTLCDLLGRDIESAFHEKQIFGNFLYFFFSIQDVLIGDYRDMSRKPIREIFCFAIEIPF